MLDLKSAFLFSLFIPFKVHSHGYVKSPRSRNWVAKEDGKWSGGTSSTPQVETCPHCLNRNSNTCGKTGGNDYDDPKNALGGSMPTNIQATYVQGQEIEISAVLTAHHKGHFEYRACPISVGVLPTQACFDANPMTFVEDMLYPDTPNDPNYPERAYIPLSSFSNFKDNGGSYLYTHKYKLPDNVSGDLVLIQWKYITGNSCLARGYNDVAFPPSHDPGTALGTCSYPLPADGNGTPEQFWNCIEVTINADGSPVAPPISPPVAPPVSPPVTAPISPPVSPPGTSPVSPPVSPPVTSPTLPVGDGHDSRVVAYLGNWLSCPSDEQLEHYTHILIAFAVTYTWSPTKNICSDTCTISSPVPVCNNSPNQNLVDSWRAKGKKVILSFGGAGMGGSWAGDVNDCWDYCYGKEQSVISQLDSIVKAQNFDGVDIDYEYFYDTQPARYFLRTVTTGLRETLPIGTEITHAPMDPDLLPHTEYYKILKDVASDLDFIMPQYYNGFTRPVSDGIDGTGVGSISALSHYETLVDDMFDGDATKVLFSFCITGCAGQATGPEAAVIMSDLRNYYPCNGGAMFWMVSEDREGSWSENVSEEILPYAGCSNGSPIAPPFTPPFSPPVSPPVTSPVAPPTSSPVTSPVAPPTSPPVTSPVAPPTSPPVTPPVATPTSPPVSPPVEAGSCPSGFTGLYPTNGCTSFVHCNGGNVISAPIPCPSGLLFSVQPQYCDWSYNVNCPV